MNIDSIQNGIVIDHITAGLGMKLYELLDLASLDASIALIKNVAYFIVILDVTSADRYAVDATDSFAKL